MIKDEMYLVHIREAGMDSMYQVHALNPREAGLKALEVKRPMLEYTMRVIDCPAPVHAIGDDGELHEPHKMLEFFDRNLFRKRIRAAMEEELDDLIGPEMPSTPMNPSS